MMKTMEDMLLFWTMKHCHRIELPYVRFPVIGPVMPPAGPRLPIFHSGRALPMLERSTTEH